MSGSDGMFKIPLIILYIAVSLAVFLLDLRLGKSRDCNIEVTLEYDEKSFKLLSMSQFQPHSTTDVYYIPHHPAKKDSPTTLIRIHGFYDCIL